MVNIVGKNLAQINIFRESDRALTEQKNLSTKFRSNDQRRS